MVNRAVQIQMVHGVTVNNITMFIKSANCSMQLKSFEKLQRSENRFDLKWAILTC